MNIRILLSAALAAISITVYAQAKPPAGAQGSKPQIGGQRGPGGGGMMRRGMPDDLKKQLALTPAQEKKIKAIQDKYSPKLKAIFEAGKGQRPDMAKVRPILEAQRKEMDAVFTPKQKETLKKWRESRRGQFRGPGGAPGAPGAPKGGAKPGKSGGG